MENSLSASACYDLFLERAFKNDYSKHQSITGIFRILVETERGTDFTSTAGSYDKQLARIKKNIEKAINKFLKSKPTEVERIGLNQMIEELPQLYQTKDIRNLLDRGLIITERFKEN